MICASADHRLAGQRSTAPRAQAPSTRKIGMPDGEQAEEQHQESDGCHGAGAYSWTVSWTRQGKLGPHLVRDRQRVADRHGRADRRRKRSAPAGSHSAPASARRRPAAPCSRSRSGIAGRTSCAGRATPQCSTTSQPYQTMPKVKAIATRQLNTSIQRCTPGGSMRSTRSGRTWPSVRTSWLAMIMIPQTMM